MTWASMLDQPFVVILSRIHAASSVSGTSSSRSTSTSQWQRCKIHNSLFIAPCLWSWSGVIALMTTVVMITIWILILFVFETQSQFQRTFLSQCGKPKFHINQLLNLDLHFHVILFFFSATLLIIICSCCSSSFLLIATFMFIFIFHVFLDPPAFTPPVLSHTMLISAFFSHHSTVVLTCFLVFPYALFLVYQLPLPLHVGTSEHGCS